jgi:hypothetical protein
VKNEDATPMFFSIGSLIAAANSNPKFLKGPTKKEQL